MIVFLAATTYGLLGGLMAGRWLNQELRNDPDIPVPLAFLILVVCTIAWPIIVILRDFGLTSSSQRKFERYKDALEMTKHDYERARNAIKKVNKRNETLVEQNHAYEDTLAAIEPYVNWREITDKLDGKFCEAWADALDASHERADDRDEVPDGQGYTPTDRWWREGLMPREEK